MEIEGRLLLLSAVWLLYFLIHSLLASLRIKGWVARQWPEVMPAYRLGFNALSTLLLIPPLYLIYSSSSDYIWRWQGPAWWLANALALLALLGFYWSLRYYDTDEFIGLRQWRQHERRVEDQEHLHISPLHRYVRHPWYSLGLILIWTRDMNPEFLLTAILATLYLIFGSWLEERKLLVYHGKRYRRYRDKVPALIPLPWRVLSKTEAQKLTGKG